LKRRNFIKTTVLSGIAISTIPHQLFSQSNIATEELIGKGSPKLFGENYQLRKEAHIAFTHMKTEALKENIGIHAVSSYRNFEHQKRIWNRKYNRYLSQGFSSNKAIHKIIEYSTIPGTSRHHWGTEIDIIDSKVHAPKYVLREENFHRDGPYIYLKQWMDKHAASYGFHLVYTNDNNRKGFNYEPWHYSYKPLSQNYLKSYKNINIKELLQKEKLLGNTSFSDKFLKTYLNENILDINPELL